jgi:Tfp pilus assembly protein PilX
MINKILNYKKQKGMTLFISIVIMAILLFISFAVMSIALKATLFASSGRDSEFAFYAADSGLECAIYWDLRYQTDSGNPNKRDSAFATSSYPTEALPRTIYCAGKGIAGTGQTLYGTTTLSRIGLGGNSNPTSVFGFLLNPANTPPESSSCAVVTVLKYYDGSNLKTYIKSRGYNTCDLNNKRRMERGVEVTY